MNSRLLRYALWGGGGILVIVGLALTVQNTRIFADYAETLRTRNRTVTRLRALQQELAPAIEARDTVARAAASAPPDMDSLLQAYLPKQRPDDVRELTRELLPGWIAVQEELTFRNVALEPVMTLIEHAAAARPPWRLVKCVIQASPTSPGTGQVVLRFETLAMTP